MRAPDELRALVEGAISEVVLSSDLGALEQPMRYALEGGKRVRGTICLATAEAAGCPPSAALPAAAALECLHAFSLVHDDLPALDNDDERRGRPSTHVAFGEGVALLAGDALLAEALRQALAYDDPEIARELCGATLGMIGGQHLDITNATVELGELHRLKTGRLFSASVGLGVRVAGLTEAEQAPWRSFAEELGLLFQVVDDMLDGDGYAERLGQDAARTLAGEAADRARARLQEIEADTATLAAIVDELEVRTA